MSTAAVRSSLRSAEAAPKYDVVYSTTDWEKVLKAVLLATTDSTSWRKSLSRCTIFSAAIGLICFKVRGWEAESQSLSADSCTRPNSISPSAVDMPCMLCTPNPDLSSCRRLHPCNGVLVTRAVLHLHSHESARSGLIGA